MRTIFVPEEIRRQAAAAVSDVIELLGADGGSVWLHDGGDYYRPVVLEGLAQRFADQMDRVPYYSVETGRPVLETHNPLIVRTDQGRHYGSPLAMNVARDTDISEYWVNRIQVDDRIIGNLSVVFQHPAEPADWKLECMDALARQLGVALECQSALEEAKSIERGLEAFSEVSGSLMACHSTTEVLQALSIHAEKLVSAEYSAVMLLDASGALTPFDPNSPAFELLPDVRIEPGERSGAFVALKEKRTVVVEDVTQPDAPIHLPFAQRVGIQALMAVPLIGFGQELGALVVGDRRPRRFSAEEVLRMETTAHQAAIALDRVNVDGALARRERELSILSEGLVDAHEQQRQRIATGLEESVGSVLEELDTLVNRIQEQLAAGNAQGALESCSRARALVQDLTRDARALSSELHPGILDDLGLVAALRWYCTQVSDGSGIEVDLQAPRRADPDQKVTRTIYRVVQESLANVVHHSQARHAEVRLSIDEDRFCVEIEDDGQGFDLSALRARGQLGLGLLGMRERARHLGGRLDVESTPGVGTRVRLELDATSP